MAIQIFIVQRRPKAKFASQFYTQQCFVRAETKGGAMKAAILLDKFFGEPCTDYTRTTVEPLEHDCVYRV